MRSRLRVTAIILAGGFSKSFFEAFGEGFKALLSYRGQKLWEIVDCAAGEAGLTNRIVIGEWNEEHKIEVLPGGSRMMLTGLGSIYRNLRYALMEATTDYVVILTADIHRLTGEIFSRFLEQCTRAGDNGLVCPVIPVELCEAEHPGAKRTSVKLVEGRFTMGNIFYAHRKTLLDNLWKIGIFLWARKKPLVLALLLGPKFVLGYLRRDISLTDLEAKAEKMLRVRIKAIVCNQPGDSAIGDDIDKVEQGDVLDEARSGPRNSIPVA